MRFFSELSDSEKLSGKIKTAETNKHFEISFQFGDERHRPQEGDEGRPQEGRHRFEGHRRLQVLPRELQGRGRPLEARRLALEEPLVPTTSRSRALQMSELRIRCSSENHPSASLRHRPRFRRSGDDRAAVRVSRHRHEFCRSADSDRSGTSSDSTSGRPSDRRASVGAKPPASDHAT